MSEVAIIKVHNKRIEEKTSKVTDKAFQMLHIGDSENNEYSGLVKENTYIPSLGENIELTYQDLDTFNSIINIKPIIEDEREMTTTKKETQTAALETEANSVEVTGTAFYAHIKYADTKGEYSKGEFKLDLGISKDAKPKLEALGLEVKNKGDIKGDFITVKSKFRPVVTLTTAEGTRDLEEGEIPLIGNGSKVSVRGKLYNNKSKTMNGGRRLLGLNTLKIEELVVYEDKTVKIS